MARANDRQGAAAFFRAHAGYSYDPKTETPSQGRARCARQLAAAEAWARDQGYSFDWRIDEETDSRDFSDARPCWHLWQCAIFDSDGQIVGSLCAIDFGRDGTPHGSDYRRVVEGKLALETMIGNAAYLRGEPEDTVADRTGPEVGGGCRCWASPRGGWSYIRKVNRISVTLEDNWGNGGKNFTRVIPFDKLKGVMTRAEVDQARAAGLLVESEDGTGFGLLTEAPKHEPKDPAPAPEIKAEIDAMRATLKDGITVATVPQLFPTPAALAARMVELADIDSGQTVLEPSAGTGSLVAAIIAAVDTEIVGYEINAGLCSQLQSRFPSYRLRVECADFLTVTHGAGQWERCVMNPPFKDGADIKHIMHAISMMKPGGRLVALCANGPRQHAHLRPYIEGHGGTWEPLPAGTFSESGTNVETVLIVLDV